MARPQHNGIDIPILDTPPDWTSDVELRVIHNTGTYEALDLSEERQRRYPRPLYGIKFTSTAIGQQQQGTLRKVFETAQAAPFGVPLWSETISLSADAAAGDGQVLTTSTADSLFGVFDFALIWGDWQTWEVIELESGLIADRLILSAPLAGAWPAGSLIVPLAFGYLKRPDFSAFDADNANLQIDFEERFLIATGDQTRIETQALDLAPVISFPTGCQDQIMIDFGRTISGLKRFLVEHSDDPSGPWDFYCEAKRNRTRLVLSNYFGGTKWIRVSLIMLDLSVIHGVALFKPEAATVAPPTISVGGTLSDPRFAFPANYVGRSGSDRTKLVLVTADQEQINYLSKPILKIPSGEAFFEVAGRKRWIAESWTSYPSVFDVTLTGPSGSTVRFTKSGIPPTGPSDGFASGDDCHIEAETFSCVLIARAFKDGCGSAPVYFLIDKEFGWADRTFTATITTSGTASCGMDAFQRVPPDCVDERITRDCTATYGTDDPGAIYGILFGAITPINGSASDRLVFVSDGGTSTSGIIPDPGTCADDVVWGGGTALIVVSTQAATGFLFDDSLATDLLTFPNSFTMFFATCRISLPVEGVDTWFDSGVFFGGLTEGGDFRDFFGPTRTPFPGGAVVDCPEAAESLVTQAGTFNARGPHFILDCALSCVLVPGDVRALDLWNSDDVV